ncbi:alkaline phosphatase-like protein [Violaceomyces palustris]|uniref:Alkaline phosphatase-like protein n=1 Tax=Violaceomyces palustris TaxID=1673888 RepID=A0ACD0P3U4_9BASI|nr:alkaline phosphatase-like protein [Violaceomyces palustris]
MTISLKQPNFLVIVADDLGFSDTGPYGSEISTPNLDRLAKGGVRLTGFHTASACSPTRSMLMSGTDNHLAGLGQMAETINRAPVYQGNPGYEGILNDRVAALPEILKDNGYVTLMSGKWHLGLTKESSPWARGFDKSFALLPGAGNHYAFEPQTEDGTSAIKFLPPLYMENDKFLSLKELPQPFYSSDIFASKLLQYLGERQASQEEKSKPFFAYLPFTAPHWPLQADPKLVEKYKGVYDQGPEVLREKRLKALIERGLVDENVTPHPVVNTFKTKPWSEWSQEEKRYSSKLMEIYAAMVEQMDTNIGRVISQLESDGELDDTFVLFMSDNGAEGALLEALPVMGDQISKVIAKYYDNSYENVGRANSFTWYGPQWAQAGTAPSSMYKGWITEGGIRCPCILSHPSLDSKLKSGSTNEFTTVMDVLPTFLELAGLKHPGKQFRGRPVLTPRGKSWAGYILGSQTRIHEEDAITGWELFGQQAIRQGDWKAVFIPEPMGPEKWQLYNLKTDPGEVEDLAEAEKERLERLVRYWADYVAETGTVLVLPEERKLNGYGPR